MPGTKPEGEVVENLAQRIWSKDGSAWTDDPAARRQIPDVLGWLDLPARTPDEVAPLESLADEARQEGFSDVFLLGMGGSSLCPQVLAQTFEQTPGYPRLTVLDTTNPDAIWAAEQGTDLAKTLFLVSSKSGGTIETLSLFRHFYARLEALEGRVAGNNFVALTDPGTSLERLAQECGFRRVISTPADVGGRYSALTEFGLVPAALLGVDLATLLARAREMMQACAGSVPADENPGLQLGLLLGRLATKGRDKITLAMPPAIASFGLWVEQLLAESTGKEGKGLIPVAGEPLGLPSVYGDDRVFVELRLVSSPAPELDSRLDALEAAGHPVVRVELQDAYDLGAEFYRWEFATAVAGTVLRINAFDQPNVQESKDNTDAVLAEYRGNGTLPTVEAAPDAQIGPFLQESRPGDYVALMAYLPPSAQTDRTLQQIRATIRDGLRVAATVGYGPRFLHSTGQLHKGGPNSGLFVQVVAEPHHDLDISGEPYTFDTLIKAQALGDLRSLETHGRRAIRVDLGSDLTGGLARLKRAVAEAVR